MCGFDIPVPFVGAYFEAPARREQARGWGNEDGIALESFFKRHKGGYNTSNSSTMTT